MFNHLTIICLFIMSMCVSYHISDDAHADEFVLNKFGVSVPCNGCIDYQNGLCEDRLLHSGVLISCEELIYNVLTVLNMRDSIRGVKVRAGELIGALKAGKVKDKTAAVLMPLLVTDPIGKGMLLSDVYILVSRYPHAVSKLIDSKTLSIAEIETLLDIEELYTADEKVVLRAVLQYLDVKEFYRIFSHLPKGDLNTSLKHVLAISEVSNSEVLKTQMKQAYDIILACSKITYGKIPEACITHALNDGSLDSALPELLRYLDYIKGFKIVDTIRLSQSPKNALLTLSMLAKINYAEYRTENMHQLVKSAATEFFADDNATIESLPNEVRDILIYFNAKDSSIISTKNRTHGFLNAIPLFIVCVSTLGIAICGLLTLKYFRKTQIEQREEVDELSAKSFTRLMAGQQREELFKLLAYFNLRQGASQDELRDAYLKRAKLLHPDMADLNKRDRSKEEFQKINNNYQLAKQLMLQRNRSRG